MYSHEKSDFNGGISVITFCQEGEHGQERTLRRPSHNYTNINHHYYSHIFRVMNDYFTTKNWEL